MKKANYNDYLFERSEELLGVEVLIGDEAIENIRRDYFLGDGSREERFRNAIRRLSTREEVKRDYKRFCLMAELFAREAIEKKGEGDIIRAGLYCKRAEEIIHMTNLNAKTHAKNAQDTFASFMLEEGFAQDKSKLNISSIIQETNKIKNGIHFKKAERFLAFALNENRRIDYQERDSISRISKSDDYEELLLYAIQTQIGRDQDGLLCKMLSEIPDHVTELNQTIINKIQAKAEELNDPIGLEIAGIAKKDPKLIQKAIDMNPTNIIRQVNLTNILLSSEFNKKYSEHVMNPFKGGTGILYHYIYFFAEKREEILETDPQFDNYINIINAFIVMKRIKALYEEQQKGYDKYLEEFDKKDHKPPVLERVMTEKRLEEMQNMFDNIFDWFTTKCFKLIEYYSMNLYSPNSRLSQKPSGVFSNYYWPIVMIDMAKEAIDCYQKTRTTDVKIICQLEYMIGDYHGVFSDLEYYESNLETALKDLPPGEIQEERESIQKIRETYLERVKDRITFLELYCNVYSEMIKLQREKRKQFSLDRFTKTGSRKEKRQNMKKLDVTNKECMNILRRINISVKSLKDIIDRQEPDMYQILLRKEFITLMGIYRLSSEKHWEEFVSLLDDRGEDDGFVRSLRVEEKERRKLYQILGPDITKEELDLFVNNVLSAADVRYLALNKIFSNAGPSFPRSIREAHPELKEKAEEISIFCEEKSMYIQAQLSKLKEERKNNRAQLLDPLFSEELVIEIPHDIPEESNVSGKNVSGNNDEVISDQDTIFSTFFSDEEVPAIDPKSLLEEVLGDSEGVPLGNPVTEIKKETSAVEGFKPNKNNGEGFIKINMLPPEYRIRGGGFFGWLFGK